MVSIRVVWELQMFVFRWIGLALLALTVMVTTAGAETLAQPTGPVILTVTGLDTAVYPDGTARFDREMLAAVGEVEITTSSIWTEGLHRYTGVLLKDLARVLQIEADLLRLHALNDYAVEFPLPEATSEAPILAYHLDGQPMSVRDKGPIWVIYPYDAGPEYRTDMTFSRSIWQLDRIDVLR